MAECRTWPRRATLLARRSTRVRLSMAAGGRSGSVGSVALGSQECSDRGEGIERTRSPQKSK